MLRNPGSFRDSSGYVYEEDDYVYRTILPPYDKEWEYLKTCGLLDAAQKRGLCGFEELPPDAWPAVLRGKTAYLLRSPRLPFISYPYEWCFSQLQAAALLTLDLQLLALEYECILKDASAYNIQFSQGKAVFIDLLSFERWQVGQPWLAYGQFCAHFLAPLALMRLRDVRCGLLLRQWLDGIPLDLASRLLPLRSLLSPGLAMHLHLHAAMRKRHGDSRRSAEKVRTMRMSIQQMRDVALSLRRAVSGLRPPARRTEWGDYYSDTNYTNTARCAKENAVRRIAASHPGRLALDLGANTGEFSRLLAPHFEHVLASDMDHTAVERHWRALPFPNVQPLLLDVSSPSPSTGWACEERFSFSRRCGADFVTALALCHHLRFTYNIPFGHMARWFAALLREHGALLVEFIPQADSQVQRLLAGRDNPFQDYTESEFIQAFREAGFSLEENIDIPDSSRRLFCFSLTSLSCKREKECPEVPFHAILR